MRNDIRLLPVLLVYTDIISDPHAISAYRALFQVLLAQESGATMYFCSHGRDRTGIATMLILSAPDVPIEVIRADYLVMPVQEAADFGACLPASDHTGAGTVCKSLLFSLRRTI